MYIYKYFIVLLCHNTKLFSYNKLIILYYERMKTVLKITNDGFSFHTFELQKSITFEEYNLFRNEIYSVAKKNCHRVFTEGNCLISDLYHGVGIIIRLYNNGTKLPHIQLRVNPRFTIGSYDYVGIFECSKKNIEIIKSSIDMVLESIKAGFGFDDMTVSRIDLCVNIETDDMALPVNYMRLIRKCRLPDSYNREVFHPETKHDKAYKDKNMHSFRAKSHEATFTVYDKIFQLKQENLLSPGEKLQYGLLRFEVSLSRVAICKIIGNYNGITNNSELLFQFGASSKMIMRNYIFHFFPDESYYTYNQARMLISESKFTNKIKKRMLFLLRKTSDCNHLINAIYQMEEEFNISGYKTDKVLTCFEQIKCSPITSLDGTIPGIRSLLTYSDMA